MRGKNVPRDISKVSTATFPCMHKISLFQFWTIIPIGFLPCCWVTGKYYLSRNHDTQEFFLGC